MALAALETMSAFVFGCTWPEENEEIIEAPRFLLTGTGFNRASTADFIKYRPQDDAIYLTPSYPTARFYAMSAADRKYDDELDIAYKDEPPQEESLADKAAESGGEEESLADKTGASGGGSLADKTDRASFHNGTRIYYNGFIHMVQIARTDKGLLNVGLRSTILAFITWLRTKFSRRRDRDPLEQYTHIAYGVKIQGKTLVPYNAKDHLRSWATVAEENGYSTADIDRHKREMVKQGINDAAGAVKCVRASLLEVDRVVSKLLVEYAHTRGCAGIGSYELPCITTVPLHAVRSHKAQHIRRLIPPIQTDGLGTIRTHVPLPGTPLSFRGGGERQGRDIRPRGRNAPRNGRIRSRRRNAVDTHARQRHHNARRRLMLTHRSSYEPMNT